MNESSEQIKVMGVDSLADALSLTMPGAKLGKGERRPAGAV